jgi:hypothetical protein
MVVILLQKMVVMEVLAEVVVMVLAVVLVTLQAHLQVKVIMEVLVLMAPQVGVEAEAAELLRLVKVQILHKAVEMEEQVLQIQ